MKHTRLNTLLTSALAAALPLTAAAQSINWTGNGNVNNGGNWSASSNWDSPPPSATDTATLGNVSTGTRTIAYDAAASGSLLALEIFQTTAGATNTLAIQRTLKIDTPFTIGATAGGAIVHFGNTASAISLEVGAGYPGITINSGGKFIHDFVTNASTGNDLKSHVTVNTGGIYQVGSSASGSSSTTAQATITKSLTLNAGSTLSLDTQNRPQVRLAVQGNFTASGATISTTNGTGGSIFLDGAANTIANTSIGSINLTLRGSGVKTLSSDTALNRLYINGRNNADLAITLSAPTTTGLYLTHENADKAVTLKLGTNLSLASNAVQLNATNGSASSTATTYVIDTAGNTLDLSAGQNYGKWTANKGNEQKAIWDLQNSNASETGTIKARAFDLSASNVETKLGANLVLEAISGPNANSLASNLSGTGLIDATSAFRFNAGNTSHIGTLESNRDIGILEVKNGTLSIVGNADFSAKGGIHISATATLDLAQRNIASGKYTFELAGSQIGKLTGGATTIPLAASNLAFDLTIAPVIGTYDMFDTTHGITGTPTSVSITGTYLNEQTIALVKNGTDWTTTTHGYTFTFSTATGYLIVAQNIPEPSTIAFLGAFAVFLIALYYRHR